MVLIYTKLFTVLDLDFALPFLKDVPVYSIRVTFPYQLSSYQFSLQLNQLLR